ncbi:hypothetical protein B9Z19DRAFT_1149829 [Tuber borchii]|uniref:SRCR domain-containing protein n=1 Tax=Tuber borchii TaxID=42251 RepID=A0A2T6ZLG9_TUBBO|nr:hypothetical protein B9Z19DRAFT_1149829 [Tuber borchii]
MKLILITAGLFASSIITTSASPHNRRRGLSEWLIGHFGGIVGEIPKNLNENDGTEISNDSDALNTAMATPTMNNLAVLASSPDETAGPTTTPTPTAPAAGAVDQAPTTITAVPTATPAVVKREVHYLDDSRHERAEARLEEEEVNMLVALLNHSFGHEDLRVGGGCSPMQRKGCAGNSVVECGSEGAWELVADCDIPGLDLACRAVRGQDFWEGGWAVSVICLESDLVR